MSSADGRRLYQHMRGQFEERELPPTKTAAQRGRVMRRAQAGDLAAKQALAEYRKTAQEATFEDLKAQRTDT